jgi:predicted RNA-binding Zn-ribbon protein involved in translation (DUF1610 family)
MKRDDMTDTDGDVVHCPKCGAAGATTDEMVENLRCPDCGYEWSS